MSGFGQGPALDDFTMDDLDVFAAGNSSTVESAVAGAANAFSRNVSTRAVEDAFLLPGREVNSTPGIAARGYRPAPVVESNESVRARGDVPMDQAGWKASPFYRESLAWDPRMTTARAAARADQYDLEAKRDAIAARAPVGGFVGMLAGSAADPINFIPVFGEAAAALGVARLGPLAGKLLVGAADAAINTAIGDVLTTGARARAGDDTSVRATLFDVGTAALIGGAFGGVSHAWTSFREGRAAGDPRAAEMAIRNHEDAHGVLNDAVAGIVDRGEVDLSQASVRALGDVFDREQGRVSTAPPAEMKALRDDVETLMSREDTAFQTGPDFHSEGANPRGAFEAAMKDVPDDVRANFIAHGVDATHGETRTEALAGILRDKPNDLNAGPLLPTHEERGTGVLATRTDAPYIAVYAKDRPMSDGPAAVIVNTRDARAVEAARKAFPGEHVLSPDEAKGFLAAPKGRVANAAPERPMRVPGRPREAPTPDVVREAEATIGKPAEADAFTKDLRLDRNDEDVAIQQMEEAGQPVDHSEINAAIAGVEHATRAGNALRAALACVIG